MQSFLEGGCTLLSFCCQVHMLDNIRLVLIGDLMFHLYAWFVLVALAIGCNDRSVLLHFGSCTIDASAMV